ncbi:serine/threonine-protein kinase-like protein CCR4 [Syzygium oleosum]|uniref:serine/threonine-protein kinase-like protein CCR4 n=1 Tax=Syzygium oleosum TaxID=219896 RepID=UPI0024B95552|nr:serine/threonine-protein kinase-like protein CCR4 [Syzygium oleosum]
MHDLLQEMGREIVRQESPENPGRRSRLWYHEDILRVFRENSGTNSVEGIKLDMLGPEEVFMGRKSIKQMKELRLFLVGDIHISGCPGYLSKDIRWLDVHGNNLPATVESCDPEQPSIHDESCDPEQPSIHDSSPTEPANNEQHHRPIKKILSRFRFKGAASRNCRGALSDFKSIMATPLKLPQFLRFERHNGYSRNIGKADFDMDMLLEEYSAFKIVSKAELVCATNNFSDDNKIGIGSSGTVYRGILGDGQEVAIKQIELTARYKIDAVITEVKTLGHVKHKNLIRLLGFHARHSECAIVYEYMNHGSLYYHLHTIGSSTLMSWKARLKVALDVARGIEYLHEFAGPRIVHRDVKSSNILLDENWTAKVSDFGLSVLLPEGEDDFEDDPKGTFGYLDPEYFNTSRITTKSDVYSYGIVLLELLSGRKPLDMNEDGRRLIVDVVVPCIVEGEIAQALDPNMPIPAPFEMTAVAQIAYLAVDCVKKYSRNRPSMTCVVDRLRSALGQLSSEFCDNMETSGYCKSSLYSSQLSDDTEDDRSCNSSLY